MSPARGLYLARAVKILTAGCESTLHEKGPASGYNKETGVGKGGVQAGVKVAGVEAKAGAGVEIDEESLRGVLEAKIGEKTYELEVFEVDKETIEDVQEAYEDAKDAVGEARRRT